MRYKLAAALFTLVSLAWQPGLAQESVPAEEFVGPFASWRQVECGGVDDTALLQSALAEVGAVGKSPVLFIKPGTCRITSTLLLGPVDGRGKHYITILGADPATTKIVWSGPPMGTMLAVNGVGHSRYGRLTWDGGGTAKSVYVLSATSGAGEYFSTSNRHEDEVFVNLALDGVAVRAGDSGVGDAETEWVRCHWLGPMAAGILLKNFNVGDYWVWDSEFQNVRYGVTNTIAGVENGAGWFAVNRSNFLNSATADMGIGNTGFFSSRWNYSRGSGQHVLSESVGSAASPWTAQGETVIDPVQTSYSFGSAGPLGLLDSTIRGGRLEGNVSVYEGYADRPGGDLWGVGNRFSNPSQAQYAAGPPGGWGRLHGSVDDVFGATIVDPGPLTLPATPPVSQAPIIEVQNGDIAAALAQAGLTHSIVHIPYGTYDVPSTLEIGPNVILTGDGYAATQLRSSGADPIVHLTGPSHAVLRDFSLFGWSDQANRRLATGVAIDNADQAGGLVHSEQWISERADVGWEVSNLANTMVDLLDHLGSTNSSSYDNGANPSVDFKVSNAKVHVFNGAGSASDQMYDLRGGELVAQTMYYESKIATLFVAPHSSGTLVLDSGRVHANPGIIDTSTFDGSLTLLNFGTAERVSRMFGPNTLALGFQFGWGPSNAELPTFTSAPYALWAPRHNDGKGGTAIIPEQSAGVADEAQFLRDHVAPLRSAVPLPVTARPADVTDVRLYRVGGQLLKSGVRVQGSVSQVRSGVE